MIRHILRKDWKLLRSMVALVLAIQVGYEFAAASSGLFEHRTGAEALLRPLMLAWFIGIATLSAAVIQQDAVPGVDQDWLIRPLNRTDLLLAKIIFLAVTISVPMFILNLSHALLLGMPLGPSLAAVLSKELFIFSCFVVPVAALASTTRNLTELMILGAALMVIFAASLSAGAFFWGPEWCPTCHTGMSWLQHLLQHIGVVFGAGVILFLQYYRRGTAYARGIAVFGAVALVFIQLPWNTAVAIERWLSEPTGHAARVTLELAEEPPSLDTTSMGAKRPAAGRTTQLLLHGNVDQAFEDLHRRARSEDSPVLIDLPVRTIGASADEMLVVDRLHTQLFRSDGRLLYRGADAGPSPGLLMADPGDATGVAHQTIEIPSKVFRAAAATSTRLQIDLSLTLVKVREEHKIAALDGELRSNDVGLCATNRDGNSVVLHCNSITQAPFCYSAALYAADGRHNPELFKCIPDYRRHWPALIDLLNFYGLELPVRDPYGIAQYPVDASELGNSYVLLKIYGERDHFKRTLTVADLQLERWREKAR
jgi:hypothetical protein